MRDSLITDKTLLLVIVLAILSHLIIFGGAPLWSQTVAVLLLAGLLPGTLFVEWLIGKDEASLSWWEQSLYGIGAGISIMVLVMLFVSYLPGPVSRWQTFVAFDLLLVVGLVLCARTRSNALDHSSGRRGTTEVVTTGYWGRGTTEVVTTGYWVLAGVLSLALVGGFFRLVNLDYSEFQGDEARAALRAAAIIQGDEDVLLIHRKGPVEILLPTVIYSMTGVLNEQMARLPFALANLAGLFALFLLGWRLFGPVAGWTAAMLLALDGYFIGFSRIVQYQSIVFLTSVLAVLILHRLWAFQKPFLSLSKGREPQPTNPPTHQPTSPPTHQPTSPPTKTARYLTLAALLLATGALSHYEAVWALIPVAYLLLLYGWRHVSFGQFVGSLVPSVLIGGAVLASFYVPFVRHPNFSQTYTYLAAGRIGSSFPYNNVADFFVRTTLYSTTYYVLLLMGLVMVALLWAYERGLGRLGKWLAAALLVRLLLTALGPEWRTFAQTDLTVILFALAFVGLWFMPQMKAQERMLWLWLGIPMLMAFFFTRDPRTHVYVFFFPWVLLCGMVVQQGVRWLNKRVGSQLTASAGVVLSVLAVLVFGTYAYWYFVYNETEVLRTWHETRPGGFWTAYNEPNKGAIFGFPLANGWKVVGELYRQGVLSGNYESNEQDSWVPDWYIRGQRRCASDANWYFLIDNLEPVSEKELVGIERILNQGFREWGRVKVNGVPRLTIYERTNEPISARLIQREEWEARFDQKASPDFPLNPPTVSAKEMAYPLHVNLDNQIWLEGYDLEYDAPLQAGDVFRLTFYWRAQQPVKESYKIFNHVYFGDSGMQAQLDAYPHCGRHETWHWVPGQLITDQHDIQVKADATPGLYPLYSGMYLQQTGQRLPVLDEAGNQTGDQIHVTDIRIGEE